MIHRLIADIIISQLLLEQLTNVRNDPLKKKKINKVCYLTWDDKEKKKRLHMVFL